MTTVAIPTSVAATPATAPAAESAWSGLKLTCKQEDLVRALSLAGRAVLATSTMPILRNILVVCDGGRLRLSATNLEIGIQVWIDAQIEQAASLCLPADLFTKVIGTFKAGKLSLTMPAAGSPIIKIEGAGSLTNVRGCNAEEYPVIPGMEGTEHPVIVDAGNFKKMIEQVAFAAEKDTTKQVMSSVRMELGAGQLTLAAADTFRLACRTIPLAAEQQQAEPLAVLIPARSLHELARVLPATNGTLKIMVTPQKNQVIFSLQNGERVDVVTRLIEGTYPNYRRAIPSQHQLRAVVDTRDFARRLEQAAIFATDDKRCVRVTFKAAQGAALAGGLVIESDNPDAGNTVSSLVAEEVTGNPEPLQILFNVQYLLDALSHIDAQQVAVEATISGRPVLLKPLSGIDYISMVQTILPSSVA